MELTAVYIKVPEGYVAFIEELPWKQTGVTQLSMDEIDAEIAAARKARREARLQSGS